LILLILFDFIQNNHLSPQISDRMKYLQDALKRLENDASRRKERLQENAALLQFMWKADVVESWIGKFEIVCFSLS